MEATHEISAVYFPSCNEIDLYWGDLSTGDRANITFTCTPEQGYSISKVVMPCVHHGAVASKERDMEEVSAEKLAEHYCQQYWEGIEPEAWPYDFTEVITQAINKATEAKDRELEAACRQLEFMNKTAYEFLLSKEFSLENTMKLTDAMEKSIELVDQIRLER